MTSRSAASSQSPPVTRARVLAGAFALIVRQGFVRLVQVVGGVLLARILVPSDFGIYAIVSLVVTLFSFVGDFGVAASLIQQRDEPDERSLRTGFTLQLIVFGSAASLVFLLAPIVSNAYRLPEDAVWLIRLLALGLLVSSLRTLPTARLERSLEFGRLAVAEAAQALVFNAIAIVLAVGGYGFWSFGVAALAGTGVNTILVNVMSPWRPGIAVDWSHARRMLRFGLPYQGSNIVSILKDAVNPLFVGAVAGTAAVGYVGWAVLLVTYPVILITILNRLYFPAFARLQDRPELLVRFADAVVRWNVGLSVGVALPFLVAAPYWTAAVFGEQWLPAVPLLLLLAPGIPIGAAAMPGAALLNAFGRSHEVLAFAVAWMVATWAFTIPLVLLTGWVGFGIANVMVQLISPYFLMRVHRLVPIDFLGTFGRVMAAALAAAAIQLFLTSTVPWMDSGPGAVAAVVASWTVYAAVWIALSATKLRDDLAALRGRGSAATRRQS